MVSMYSVRTIFLMVRGIDRTGNVFRDMDTGMTKLIKKQIQLQRIFSNLIFAGAAFLSFATFLSFGFTRIIGMSSLGALYVEDFRRIMEKLGIVMSELLIKNLRPWIEGFLRWLNHSLASYDFESSSIILDSPVLSHLNKFSNLKKSGDKPAPHFEQTT